MGGADVTPSTYGQEVTYARDFNLERDTLEIALIQAYVKAGKGFVFGVCRGLQITSVALGLEMKYQDIPAEAKTFTNHDGQNHESFQRKTPFRLLETFLGGAQPYSIYSFHHESVDYKPNNYVVLASVSPEGIVEALEFANGRGLLTQGHPEMYTTSKGRKIMAGVDGAIKANAEARSCGKALTISGF
ncbi:Peptidase C26 [compost metagenome]